jgi:3D-(3,5/4)-trihydroxycyclohexane-1,2-dione acylhydrolase (decyclizing)
MTSLKAVEQRAKIIAKNNNDLNQCIDNNALPKNIDVSLSEGIILGLLKQNVRKYFAIFGHGSTDFAEILRIYEEQGVTKTYNFRNEVEMAHAATALRWQYNEVPAVVTSIGPGALQAMAGSLAASSNGVGLYHIYGDETTYGEGYNMQQVPKREQDIYGKITALMSESHVFHTPESIRDAMRKGYLKTKHPYKAGPFYFMLPINTQPKVIKGLNLITLPGRDSLELKNNLNDDQVEAFEKIINKYENIVIKAGGGSIKFSKELTEFSEHLNAPVVLAPGSLGVLPDAHENNMHVGGSKGSISGNYAMQNAKLLISIGSRSVCQSDCSGIGYPNAETVININADLSDMMHYNNTLGLNGDIGVILKQLNSALQSKKINRSNTKNNWIEDCRKKKKEWNDFKNRIYQNEVLKDDAFDRDLLTQPAAIKTAVDFSNKNKCVKFFDAGDVQANGFQIAEDNEPSDTYTETGASYMGFSASAILASAIADKPKYPISFTGDGSFMMNPQVLIDAVYLGLKGMVVIFDNRRMAAITGLQYAQYEKEFKTNDGVEVDYVQMANSVKGVKGFFGGYNSKEFNTALEEAYKFDGLSVVHVPVYSGTDELGGMGAYGSWNVGNWCENVQAEYAKQKI